MNEKPEVLRLAEFLDTEWSGVLLPTRQKAATELRRLHADNEAKDVLLRQAWAVIRWQCFGECRTEGVEGLPTPSEVDVAIRQHLKETK